jgi:hypothetical protein
VGAALANGWESQIRGGTPPQKLTMGPVQKNQTNLNCTYWGHERYISSLTLFLH